MTADQLRIVELEMKLANALRDLEIARRRLQKTTTAVRHALSQARGELADRPMGRPKQPPPQSLPLGGGL